MDPHLLLAVAEGVGPGLVPALLDPDLDAARVLADPPPTLPPAVQRRLRDPSLVARARCWQEDAARLGLHVLTPSSPDWPERLQLSPLRPLVLFARGDPRLLRARPEGVTVIGSRTPTPYGAAAAADFTRQLGRAGLVVWSGLADGIDGIAHRTALEVGAPTVAVLAGALDRVYPRAHQPLADAIVARGGLLLTEAPPGQRAMRGHFPRRNRILAAAVEGVLVVEAGQASGSLHTARFAAEFGVPVFAVPGPYTSSRSRGCHDLIAEGAQIARDPEDLLRRLGVEAAMHAPAAAAHGEADAEARDRAADATAILRVLESGPRPRDLVWRESRLERARYLRAVLDLTARGQVRLLPGDLLAKG